MSVLSLCVLSVYVYVRVYMSTCMCGRVDVCMCIRAGVQVSVLALRQVHQFFPNEHLRGSHLTMTR